MMRRYLLPLLALLGVAIIIIAIIIDNPSKPVIRPAVQWPAAPFASYVAGAGIVEAGGGNIAVGTPVSGIVTAIYVKPGDHVKADDRLFKIDDRDLQAQLVPARAKVNEAEAKLAQAANQFQLAENVPDRRAVSKEEMNNRRAAVAIAEATLALAKAQVEQTRLDIERRSVRALVPGKVLQINIRVGEFAQSGVVAKPLVLLGDDAQLYLRIDIDEYDAWRIRPGAPAVAFVRGRPEVQTSLKFERIEPYVVPKTSLTGGSTERVDTRVLQLIYSFDPSTFRAYVGQQIDVYIEAPPAKSESTTLPNERNAHAKGNTQ